MSNELIFLLIIVLDILFVFICSRRNLEWLLGSILVNLLLIGIFGVKLIEVFGFTTNIGNVFYASAFFATHFLLEKYGRTIAIRTIWDGVMFIAFFNIMSQLATHFIGLPVSTEVNTAISNLFAFSIRIVLASIVGFIFAQYININIYEWLSNRTKRKSVWLCSLGAISVSQLADSMLFFSIAFFDLAGPILLQMILIGWVIKVSVGIIGIPFLYFGNSLDKKNEK